MMMMIDDDDDGHYDCGPEISISYKLRRDSTHIYYLYCDFRISLSNNLTLSSEKINMDDDDNTYRQ